MIYNNEQVDFILLGVTEADGGVRIIGLSGITRGYLQQQRASAYVGPLMPEGLAVQSHGEASLTASYSGTHPVSAFGATYAEAFAELGLDPAESPAEEGEE